MLAQQQVGKVHVALGKGLGQNRVLARRRRLDKVPLGELQPASMEKGSDDAVQPFEQVVPRCRQDRLVKLDVDFVRPPVVGRGGDLGLGGLVLAGTIKVSDRIKQEAAAALSRMKRMGVEKTVMLTGDEESVAAKVASKVGITDYYANLLPEEKVAIVEELMVSGDGDGRKLLFVGDGINDAPVISRADIGVAMGAMGTDAAVEAADVVLMDDEPSKIATAISIGRRTKAIVWQNIVLALGVKIIFVALGVVGSATMWQAVIADVGVALLAVLNAARLLASKKP